MNNWDSFNKTYSDAKGEGMDFKPLPSGPYKAKILQNSFDQDKFIFERKFEIITGEYTGRSQMDWIRLFKKDGSPNDVSADRIKAEIKALDPTWADTALQHIWSAFCSGSLNQIVDIYISTKPRTDGQEGMNSTVNIKKFLDSTFAPGPQGPDFSSDDIPF